MTRPRRGLRVGVDARSLLCREPRGEGKTLLQLYRGIVDAHPDWRIEFFGDARAREATQPLPPGIRVRHLSLPGDRFDSWDNVALPLLALRARCNVLHCASSSGPRWCPVPSLLTVHDLIPVVADDGVDAAFQQAFLRRLRHGLRQADRVVAVSHNTRDDLLRVLPEHARAPIEVVYWGATPTAAGNGVGDPPAAAPYLVAFAGEAPRKNTGYVLDRFIALAARDERLELLLLGVSGERERAAIGRRVDAAGVTGRLRLPGFVAEEELDRLLRGARALFYPSLYEGFGMPVLEAIERGVPVVASDRSSIPEILAGVPGCFDLADTTAIERTLLELATDDAERARWAAAQRRVLARFTWQETARRTAELLEAVAGQRPV